jgi:hypothetical protein
MNIRSLSMPPILVFEEAAIEELPNNENEIEEVDDSLVRTIRIYMTRRQDGSTDWGWSVAAPTHWMPIPEPPREQS